MAEVASNRHRPHPTPPTRRPAGASTWSTRWPTAGAWRTTTGPLSGSRSTGSDRTHSYLPGIAFFRSLIGGIALHVRNFGRMLGVERGGTSPRHPSGTLMPSSRTGGSLELDRHYIERKDFTVARRGYDQEEVDLHLRELGDTIAELRAQIKATPAGIAGAAAEQVRQI